jgi:kinesin family protein 3/17
MEKAKNCKNIIDIDSKIGQVTINKPDKGTKTFRYDAVATMDSTQQQVYTDSAFNLIESTIEGYNATIFAYGQTGCGKTHTMIGEIESDTDKGIMPRSFDHIFSVISANEGPTGKKYLVRCSFIEIYNEDIHDLLSSDPNKKKAIKEDPNMGVFVKDVSMYITKSVDDIKKALVLGSKNRKKGETLMNRDSSRSHCMFTLYVETQETIGGEEKIKVGKLNLVDLAGSERQKKSGAANERLKEASNINLSLTSLMNVISALVNPKKTHIPYRDSKLTRLLEDSLGGNTKTCMIANISPADYNFEETMSTLRYANRAKNIKNQPTINEDPKDALLREYMEEIKRLKEMLKNMQEGGDAKPPVLNLKDSVDSRYTENGKPKPSSFQGSRISSARINDEDELELSNSEFLTEEGNERRYSVVSDSNEDKKKNQEEIENVLKRKEEELTQEKTQKQQLEGALKALEEKLAQGNIKVQEQVMKKMQDYRELQLKLEEEKRIQDKLLQEKLKKEEEMIMVEKDYKSLQEEVDEQRKLIRVLRNKYKDAVEEIKDLGAEANNEREYLGTALMEMHKEMNLYKSILHTAFSHDEIDRIVARAKYNPDNKVWKVPHFMFRQNKVNLFNANKDRIQDMRMTEKDTHTLYFPQDARDGVEDRRHASLPPAVPGSVTPSRHGHKTSWNHHKSGKKSLADFSNERNVANKSEYYIGVPPEEAPKFKIVKKLTTSGSGVKLTPIKGNQDLTDSSSESNRKNVKSTANIVVTHPQKKAIPTTSKPIEISDELSDSEELLQKAPKGKEKIRIKSKKLFSRGKQTKKPKAQRIGKMISYIELY